MMDGTAVLHRRPLSLGILLALPFLESHSLISSYKNKKPGHVMLDSNQTTAQTAMSAVAPLLRMLTGTLLLWKA